MSMQRHTSRGATYIEFTIAFLVFLGLLGSLVDISLGLFHRGIVSRTVIQTSRDVSAELARNQVPLQCRNSLGDLETARCSQIEECAERIIRDEIQKHSNGLQKRVALNVDLEEIVGIGRVLPMRMGTTEKRYAMDVSADLENLCLFCKISPKMFFHVGNRVALQRKLTCR